MAFRSNSFQFLWIKENSKPPTMPFRIVACTFLDNLSRNSCIHAVLISLRAKHNTRILYYKRGNAVLEITSYPAIIEVAITSHFAAARVLFFGTCFWCESSTKVNLWFSYGYLVMYFAELWGVTIFHEDGHWFCSGRAASRDFQKSRSSDFYMEIWVGKTPSLKPKLE